MQDGKEGCAVDLVGLWGEVGACDVACAAVEDYTWTYRRGCWVGLFGVGGHDGW